MKRSIILAVMSVMLLSAAGRLSADIIIGNGNQANAAPFGNDGIFAGGRYQQLYKSSAFSEDTVITSVGFSSQTGGMGRATYTIEIGLANAATSVSAPSATFDDNIGGNYQAVYSGILSADLVNDGNLYSNSTFDLTFQTTPYQYNVSGGDLLLEVRSAAKQFEGFPNVASVGFLGGFSTDTSRVFQGVGTPNQVTGTLDDNSFGLVTRFGTTSTVPSPSAFAVACIGVLAGYPLFIRRKLTQQSGGRDNSIRPV